MSTILESLIAASGRPAWSSYSFDGVHVCKSTERELPAAFAMTVPAGIVDGDVAGFDGEGAQCSLSLGAVMEDM